jgi:hypothetical protein
MSQLDALWMIQVGSQRNQPALNRRAFVSWIRKPVDRPVGWVQMLSIARA